MVGRVSNQHPVAKQHSHGPKQLQSFLASQPLQPESTNTQKKSKFRLRVVMVLSSQTCFCYVLQRYAHLGTHSTHQIASIACFPWHHAFQCSLHWSSSQGILSIFATKLHNLTVQTWWHLTADLLVVLQTMCKDLGGIFAGHRLHVQHHLPHGWVHCLGSTRVYPHKIEYIV